MSANPPGCSDINLWALAGIQLNRHVEYALPACWSDITMKAIGIQRLSATGRTATVALASL
jgi:hypothetical protein